MLLEFGGQTHQDFWKERSLHKTELYLNTLRSVENLKECQCCFCGFADGEYLELHHKNGDHDDFSLENLDTICSLCHRTLHLGWAMVDNCCSLGMMKIEPDQQNQGETLDYSIYNLLYRTYFLVRYQGRNLQKLHNTPYYEWFTKLDEYNQKEKTDSLFNPFFGLGDVLVQLSKKEGLLEEFLQRQKSSTEARFSLLFNIRAFIPIRSELTLKSRLDFYARSPQFQESYFDSLISRQL